MAAVNPFKSLRDEATCSICLSYFKDPVSLDCGHNFCRACISQCWEGSDADTSCPQCRETFAQRTLRPNRPLANFVEIAKQLSFQAAGKEDLCKEHQEGFKLFCNQDQILICVICRESQAHRAHTVVPIEEAAQVYKEKIKSERQKIVSEFEQLRLFLEEQERLLLARLEELEKEIVELQVENVTKLSEEISCLSDLISEIEEKCHQSTSEFLQDIKSTWSRCEKVKVQKPVAVPQDLRKELSISSQRNVCLQEALKKFKETLPYQLRFLISKAEKEVQTTLDQPNPCFVISTDNSAVKHQNLQQQNKFYPAPCVLGYKGFTSGRCHWEVEVQMNLQWVLGIAKESVIHEGVMNPTPEKGIWALEYDSNSNRYWALTSPKTPIEPPHHFPYFLKIRVYLDYEGEKVKFYFGFDSEPIFTFTSSFTGKIIPFVGRRYAKIQHPESYDYWSKDY
ncbi:zinc finger protein RFP-like isoform X2 [Emydura macquarii macquarii]|uniref:zinc finger protein RFP-like isoform X2 n=1 Tax=Emydura macquarii macquarii TaxID=1129001 RepID=UPI00352A1305